MTNTEQVTRPGSKTAVTHIVKGERTACGKIAAKFVPVTDGHRGTLCLTCEDNA